MAISTSRADIQVLYTSETRLLISIRYILNRGLKGFLISEQTLAGALKFLQTRMMPKIEIHILPGLMEVSCLLEDIISLERFLFVHQMH